MKITVRHTLRSPIAAGTVRATEHVLLTPVSTAGQTIAEWRIEMPGIETAARFTDAFGNRALLVNQTRPEGDLAIAVTGTVETFDRAGVLGRPPGEPVVALYRRVTALTEPDPRVLEGFAAGDRRGGNIGLLHALMARVGEVFGVVYEDAEDKAQPVAEAAPVQTQTMGTMTQSQGFGSQSQTTGTEPAAGEPSPADPVELAHAFIGATRALDIPARFVTGYLIAEADDAASFHAWAEAYDEGLGWIGFDCFLGHCPIDRHVRVAAGLDALSARAVRVVPAPEPDAAIEGSVEAVAQ